MIHLAIIWHQHQPLYRDLGASGAGCVSMPWVRLHAIRDYFSMAHLVGQHTGLRLTLNFSPSLLLQIEDHVERGATDAAWELSRTPAENLDDGQREAILATFFAADAPNQIFPHLRYRQLYERRRDRLPFSTQDLRDLQVWFNLAWFGKELRDGPVALPGGTTVSVARLVEKGAGFGTEDVEELLQAQLTVMGAIVPEHRRLVAAGQLELSASPFFHPILPLLIDTDRATVDRPGTRLPARFHHPEDADAQIALAVESFKRWFGAPPIGAWPSEGAVSPEVVPFFARHGIRWIASDQGVLARSGKWGYEVGRSEVRHRVYRAEQDGAALSLLFRDTELSDDIGFRCRSLEPEQAAAQWIAKVKRSAAEGASSVAPTVTIVLDGENPWGTYRDDGRPFLRALYAALVVDGDIRTVTPGDLLDGNAVRAVVAQPLAVQAQVYELFTGSWIDEGGSRPGVDLGTWIGEPEENAAWELLGAARRDLAAVMDSKELSVGRLALLAAEGSDWFWWMGSDQESEQDPEFEALFRLHLRSAYLAAGLPVPAALAIPLISGNPAH